MCPSQEPVGGESVMVYRGILGGLKTRLVVVHGNLNAPGYMNQILVSEAVPFIQGSRIRSPCNMTMQGHTLPK